ncbi:suppressor of fused domain protein [Paenibacillus barcinonensis]|uniref:Suppressor of fused domain protein n=1 Tax=Paenibacillus barcinonensis TaxID=198119 RepID=A0A2V4VLJ2_PAEBA|nr:suppressor of fused domain protein [Paenibacillus barcinonensis]PYE45660.1 suppressor of fused protein SUFU [Paenibacillus barcinonensis]QKS56243.1 suppressor of fused domain protein [Paenibacillus barcinonensis]
MAFEQLANEEQFTLDIRRTYLLGAYMNEWGMPESRIVLSQATRNIHVEIYYFPATMQSGISRFVTVNLSQATRPSGEQVSAELMLALPSDLGGVTVEVVNTYVADLITHHIENAPNSNTPRVMKPSALAPAAWNATALLIDELRGENESLEHIHTGQETVSLLWMIPITAHEADLILGQGIDEFDVHIENSDYSIIDPLRP